MCTNGSFDSDQKTYKRAIFLACLLFTDIFSRWLLYACDHPCHKPSVKEAYNTCDPMGDVAKPGDRFLPETPNIPMSKEPGHQMNSLQASAVARLNLSSIRKNRIISHNLKHFQNPTKSECYKIGCHHISFFERNEPQTPLKNFKQNFPFL